MVTRFERDMARTDIAVVGSVVVGAVVFLGTFYLFTVSIDLGVKALFVELTFVGIALLAWFMRKLYVAFLAEVDE
jgi:hypothetical protein